MSWGRGKDIIRKRQHWKQGPHNAGLVLWFGVSSPSWAEEWKRLSAGMSGVPSNRAGRMTGQWEQGFHSGGLIFSWWTQPPASQCSLIARAEITYGLCLEGPNDRTNHAWRKKGVGGGLGCLLVTPPSLLDVNQKSTQLFYTVILTPFTHEVHGCSLYWSLYYT